MSDQPIYPKSDPEYRQRVLSTLYKKVSNTKWDTVEENKTSKKGRKPKEIKRIESRPRTEGEKQAITRKNIFDFVKKTS